jgi:hypothetical protein
MDMEIPPLTRITKSCLRRRQCGGTKQLSCPGAHFRHGTKFMLYKRFPGKNFPVCFRASMVYPRQIRREKWREPVVRDNVGAIS